MHPRGRTRYNVSNRHRRRSSLPVARSLGSRSSMRHAMHLLLLCLIVPAWCRLVVPGKLGKSDGETAPRFK
eukprot:6860827-Prymnesium_polylepis.1